MTNNQKELTKNLYNILCDLAQECYNDEEFNNNIGNFIQGKNITNYSLDNLALIISNYLE